MWPLLCWGMLLLYILCWVFFIRKGYWILLNTFFVSIEMFMIFIFHFINVIYHIYWFTYVEPFLHPRNESHLTWCMIILMGYWIRFANILLIILASIFIRDIGLYFSFPFIFLSGFSVRVMLAYKMSLQAFPPLHFLGRVW